MQPTFRDLIRDNKRKSLFLVVGFCGFTIIVALVLGLGLLAFVNPDALEQIDLAEVVTIGAIGALVAIFLSLLAYYRGDRMVLDVSGARPIAHAEDPELYNVVEEMAIAAGVAMPRVYVIDDDALNAFATGRDPEHAAVCVTTGLRRALTRDELQGVIAHEMSHVRNYDIRLMLLTAALVGTIAILSNLFWQMARTGPAPPRGRRDEDREKGTNALVAVLIVASLLLAALAPLLARLIQMAVSRQREYLADASGVELTRYPQGLASALRKISSNPTLESANSGTAHLFIANPIGKFQQWASTAFASHPPIDDRIARLEALLK